MAREFKETAHLKTNLSAYSEGWERIFKKYACNCHLFEDCVCNICKETEEEKECQKSEAETK